MLTETQLERYADVLLWALKTARSGRYYKGHVILIRYDRAATRLAEIIFRRIIDRGMHPIQRATATPDMERVFYQGSNNRQLTFRAPGETELCEGLHGSIFLYAPESITHLSDVDPGRIGRTAVARKPLRDILTQREEGGDFGWTLCAFPTAELARHANLDLRTYTDQIVRACFLDAESPVAEWESIYKRAVAAKRWLNSLAIETLHVESDHIDLTVTPGRDRRWIGLSGHNIPSFEIFLSPDWRGTEGRYYANQPSFRSGNYVQGVTLDFKKGEVVEASADTGEAFVKQQLATDGGANRIGEFSLTDRRFSRIDRFMANTLFDENHGGEHGNCHLAVGASYSDAYAGDPKTLTRTRKRQLGFNDSAIHWDLVNTEPKRVTARLQGGGSQVIYEEGRFTAI